MWRSRRARNFQFAGFALALGLLVVLSRFFSVVDVVGTVQYRVTQWGIWGAICYPWLFALCNLLLLPGGILCVGSGFFFGLWWGFLIVLVGNSIAAAAAFGISRSLGQHWFRKKLSEHRMLRALEPAVQREGWKIVVLSQLHPLFPTSLVNYLFGLTRIPFRTYMTWVTLGRVPGLFLYAYLGTLGQFGLNLVRGKTHPRMLEYWIWGGAFVITALFLLVLSRIAMRALENAQVMDSRRSKRPKSKKRPKRPVTV